MRRRTAANRFCTCGATLKKRRRYCDICRDARKRGAKAEYEQRRPGRSHHVSGLPQNPAEGLYMASGDGAIVNMTNGSGPAKFALIGAQ